MTLNYKKYTDSLKKGETRDALNYRNEIHHEYLNSKLQRAGKEIKDIAIDAALSDEINRTNLYAGYRNKYNSLIPEEPLSLMSKRILLTKEIENIEYHNRVFIEQQPKYMSFLRGKEVHIIGPSETFEDQLEMFTDNDNENRVFVILNPYDNKSYLDKIKKLSNTKRKRYITYFNGEYGKRYFKYLAKRNYELEIKPIWMSHKASHICGFPNNSREFAVPTYLPFSSYAGHSLNMLQLIIYDLAFTNPECLFISGFDFYTSEDIYKKGYVDNTLEKIKEEVRYSMIEGGHDPITNIRYFKYLVNRCFSKVKLSSKLSKVVALDELEYLNLLKVNILKD